MWDSIQQVATFFAGVLFILWSITGAHQWLRYGCEGLEFQLSKEYSKAVHEFRQKKIEEKEQCEVEARTARRPDHVRFPVAPV